MSTQTDKDTSLADTGRCAYAALAEMVAALQCDYDRLEELREEREALASELASAENTEEDPGAYQSAEYVLRDWDTENREELLELESAAGECESEDDARERIQDDALSIEVRSDWQSPSETLELAEFCILLTTGGPAVRIVGELDNGEPSRPRLEVQDWGTPWTHYTGEYKDGAFEVDSDVLLAYCSCFYFGE